MVGSVLVATPGVVSGRFGKVRHAGPGLEEAVKAKASWGPSEARGPMRGSRSQSQEVQLRVSFLRDLANELRYLLYLQVYSGSRLKFPSYMLVRDVTLLLFKAHSLDSMRNLG